MNNLCSTNVNNMVRHDLILVIFSGSLLEVVSISPYNPWVWLTRPGSAQVTCLSPLSSVMLLASDTKARGVFLDVDLLGVDTNLTLFTLSHGACGVLTGLGVI